MGAFLVRLMDHDSGAELGRFAATNILAYEGIQYVLRQIFPPYQAAMTFQVGVCGATVGYPNSSPNPAGGASFGPNLTFAQCTDANANEGGCYTSPMRTSFGYARQAAAFTASLEADGGALVSPEVTFPNNHSWAPQAGSAWDFPWTPEEIEQPPPEWAPKESWEPVLGYPWQRPRKRCGTDCDPYNPNVCIYPYMHQWDASGELDWLCDFRKIGGFPITLAFLADSSRSKLVAAAAWAASRDAGDYPSGPGERPARAGNCTTQTGTGTGEPGVLRLRRETLRPRCGGLRAPWGLPRTVRGGSRTAQGGQDVRRSRAKLATH